MRENYDFCLKQVLKYEGGYSNHPADPGGATMKGVTQATYDAWRAKKGLPKRSVKLLADDELAAIYRQEYWDKVRGDDLPAGVDLAVFDFAVNSGVSRAAKYLQAIVGVTQDGVIGPATIAATKAHVANAVTNKRLSFMQSLSTWPTFGKGWRARIDDIRKQIARLT